MDLQELICLRQLFRRDTNGSLGFLKRERILNVRDEYLWLKGHEIGGYFVCYSFCLFFILELQTALMPHQGRLRTRQTHVTSMQKRKG